MIHVQQKYICYLLSFCNKPILLISSGTIMFYSISPQGIVSVKKESESSL